jgi:gluconokinase
VTGAPRVVVMGVSAVGKSTVGTALADRLGISFLDADDLHPRASVEKMRAGLPLTDEDRAPWLRICGEALGATPDGVVLACSALARRYRDALRAVAPDAFFVYLAADRGHVLARASSRDGHFMPVSLLASQFDALEPLQRDESGATIDAAADAAAVVDAAVAAVLAAR